MTDEGILSTAAAPTPMYYRATLVGAYRYDVISHVFKKGEGRRISQQLHDYLKTTAAGLFTFEPTN